MTGLPDDRMTEDHSENRPPQRHKPWVWVLSALAVLLAALWRVCA